MNLNLFSREYFHSDLSYEENLKLKPLLESFCMGTSDKLILELLSCYGSPEEVLKRQEFFREICENESARNLLKKLRVFFRPVESAVAFYQRQPGFPERHIWGLNLLESYVAFAENTVNEKISSEIIPQSQLFANLIGNIETAVKSQWFSELKENINIAQNEFQKIRKINLVTNYRNSMLTSYELSEETETSFREKCSQMFQNLGLETDNERKYSTDDVDLYERYSRYIVDKHGEFADLLKRVNTKYAPVISGVENLNVKDISIALACCEFYDFLKSKGVELCYPSVSEDNALSLKNARDISLLLQKDDVVPNDINLTGKEKVVFISGANGGGKTSFVRAVGICNILFSCGLFVPAAGGELGIWDNIFTMFPHKEQLSERGRFVTEKQFFETVMNKTTKDSLVLANELFSSTNEATALEQFNVLISDIEKKGGRVFFVTHFTQVVRSFQDRDYPAFSCKMENETVTFKVVRSGGHSSSVSMILEKYGLTKLQLRERLK